MISMGRTNDKLKRIQEGLEYLADLDLIDAFYDGIWSTEGTYRLLDIYKDKNQYYDLPLEETDTVKQQVIEWFGKDHGLAKIEGEFWMLSVGSVEEGGNKWWFKIKLNTDNLETARKVVMFDKFLSER